MMTVYQRQQSASVLEAASKFNSKQGPQINLEPPKMTPDMIEHT